MRFGLIVLLVISSLSNTYGITKKIVDGFRSSNWGDNISEVRSKEIADKIDSLIYNGFTILVYKGNVAERNAFIYYGFKNNRLLFGSYTFLDDHTNDSKAYFNDYEKIKNLISDQYNSPSEDKWISANHNVSLYKENGKLAASALELGILELKSRWNLQGGSILLSLKQEHGIYIKVKYLSNDFLNKFDPSDISMLEKSGK